MRARTLLLVAMAAGLAAAYRRDRRRLELQRAAPRPLQTWEGEGGGVPVDRHRIAAQVAPRDLPVLRDEARPTEPAAPAH